MDDFRVMLKNWLNACPGIHVAVEERFSENAFDFVVFCGTPGHLVRDREVFNIEARKYRGVILNITQNVQTLTIN